MQMSIVVCDDEVISLQNIKNKIIDVSRKIKVYPEIITYDSGRQVVEMICNRKKSFHIVLLDMEMPDISGLEVARQIREADSDIILIFISAYEQYVFDSIQYKPFRYIRKERMEQELPSALKAAYSCVEQNWNKFIIVKTDKGEVRIKRSDIMYYETEARKIRLYMNTGNSFFVGKTIKGFYEELCDKDFIRIHSGCVVNTKYINEYSLNEIILDNGKHLVVSRTRIKEVKNAILHYWGEKI
ncbi:MAG: LytTR family DNA-binding domain-containing protein [Lachnospiraceae bacterium]|nr:LytTR family DNA-binding domain-containing protein [Lachnospiraceae bacterium]